MLREEGKFNVNACNHVPGVLDKHLKDVHYVDHGTVEFEPWTSSFLGARTALEQVETRSRYFRYTSRLTRFFAIF